MPEKLTPWARGRPTLEDTNVFIRSFTRLNVYLYSKPPSRTAKRINRAFMTLNIQLYRRSGGRILGRFGRLDAMLITTTGRRTGKERTNPVGYVYDRGRYIVCAAPGHFDVPGGPTATQPAWYLNLTADPRATADIGPERLPVTARILEGDERERMWRRFTDVLPFMNEFQKRVQHRLPVVELTPDDLTPRPL
ncbi:nitroreductase/quinone reductase family protein [Streptomyces sp. I05A-00742]|uniref:nitroreductase/quinone reductase family protein n=1 Tax=Streptomyces sp. I05A-00742 TaxID=2732853 RepID=UPI0014890DDB|nr:nitroreductase/quinone reductase family protein [Streptomyces sp. I05A-00742]